MSSQNNPASIPGTPFFIRRSGKIFGPFSQRQIEKGKLVGKFLPADRISYGQNGPWREIASSDLQALSESLMNLQDISERDSFLEKE